MLRRRFAHDPDVSIQLLGLSSHLRMVVFGKTQNASFVTIFSEAPSQKTSTPDNVDVAYPSSSPVTQYVRYGDDVLTGKVRAREGDTTSFDEVWQSHLRSFSPNHTPLVCPTKRP